ncbi:protein OSB2, chloroplastic-like [Quillaja saponaria]|uniref:Protein OSB2, chloroplastic-like n=1 Tax=Quillaja saponaria TaxID=32244 RepID=A0AAD7Q0S3_QUISA|nr:protein OSB2, chloroplastic-like [Quillaja saponaria]
MDDLSNNYNQVSYSKPPEIPWKKELCNSVNLIGIVATPVEIKHLPSGKAVAWTRLAVKKSATQTSWISLTFWDELAHVASQHVEKDCQIYVSGRLVSDSVDSDDGKQQTYYKVVVQQLNFVEKNLSPVTLYGQDPDYMSAGRKLGNNAANSTDSVEEVWQAFFANPVDWWDNRKNKRNPKYTDLKHKDTGEALWVEGRYNPPWVKSQLAILDTRMGSLP